MDFAVGVLALLRRRATASLRAFLLALIDDLGLSLGKQAGVLAATRAAVYFGLGVLPEGVGWRRFHGMAVLCGIGFTMSLFIGLLAICDLSCTRWRRASAG